MRTLFLTGLLLLVPGAARAEGGAPPSQPEKPAKAAKPTSAKGAGTGASAAPKKEGAKPAASKAQAQGAPEKDGAKGAAAPAPPPCEPVKPCPID
jgi:hypothetical protein